jgi:hypothetical protein
MAADRSQAQILIHEDVDGRERHALNICRVGSAEDNRNAGKDRVAVSQQKSQGR